MSVTMFPLALFMNMEIEFHKMSFIMPWCIIFFQLFKNAKIILRGNHLKIFFKTSVTYKLYFIIFMF